MFFRYGFALTLAFAVALVGRAQRMVSMHSFSGQMQLTVELDGTGQLFYLLDLAGSPVCEPSPLGMALRKPEVQLTHFNIVSVDSGTIDNTWQPVWGEERSIRNHCKELVVHLKSLSSPAIALDICFRLFDDGLGFRYVFPEQPDLHHFIVGEELTGFRMSGNHKTFWIPGDYDSNEYRYRTTRLSEINALGGKEATEISVKDIYNRYAVQTPLMMKSGYGMYINIHEAALDNYPAMQLIVDTLTFLLRAHLVPDAVGNKAYLQAPAQTPWRTVIASTRAADILASRIILNLNEPNAIGDTSWIKPQKFVGVWWEMHVGKSSWDYSGTQVGSQQEVKTRHGATTANVKKYIDFAAAHGISSVLVEGWNTGWEDWFGNWKEDVFDFVTPYPDFDVNELAAYARARGVKLIMHHETSGSATNYERQMDTAYRFMKNHGYDAVKTGYVGRIIPRGEHHDGQWMVRHYVRVAQKTASYQIMLDAHEPVRPTGLQRTYPNWLACEAARGNEFNAWSKGNLPEHETILPFTRLMGGPMDYTPGIFRIRLNQFDSAKKEQVHTTLCKQLALYVTMYSPLQMAADLPENYEAKPDAFQFIEDVAVDWDATEILEAEPGDYLSIARKAKGRDDWFAGTITDEQARTAVLPLSFLDRGTRYVLTLYRDGKGADWEKNPEAYVIENFIVDSGTTLRVAVAPGGGAAMRFRPAAPDEINTISVYGSKKKARSRR